jgi:methyl-accepting chemotaxis protein
MIAGFMTVAVIAAAVGLVGILYIHKISVADTHLYENNTVPLAKAGALDANFQLIRNLFGVFIVEIDEAKRKVILDEIEALHAQNNEGIEILEAAAEDEEQKKLMEELKQGLTVYREAMDKIVALLKVWNFEVARLELHGPGRAAAEQLHKVIARIVERHLGEAEKTARANRSLASMAMTIATVLTLFGAFVAALLGFLLTLAITRPINRIVAGMTEGVDQVVSAACQVSSASHSLAEESSEQASSLEETSSSLEEMASMTKQNADNANQAKAMMADAKQIVAKVDGHMGRMAASIEAITRSSEETGKIIKTIDEIAFQTNLLALNAAVEAARAGEAGAGFAVVAGEVRNLALRAAEAARNTSGLIENTIKAVRQGNELTAQTREAFRENVEVSGKVAQLIDEIAAASLEQAQGIAQVNRAVSEMDKVTQATAANAEESASAAEELNAQAAQMQLFVGELAAMVGVKAGAAARNVSGGGPRDPLLENDSTAATPAGRALPWSAEGAAKTRRSAPSIPQEKGHCKDF